MLSMNAERLEQVVQEAFDKASEGKNANRWTRAIVKAWQQLQENPYIEQQGDEVLVLSPSLEIYKVNGRCINTATGQPCRAHQQGYPCWHRAMKRLVERYNQTSH